MRRAHRAFHRIVWPILAALVVLGAAMALALRPPPEHPPPSDNAATQGGAAAPATPEARP
jgi:hypothetical protein